MRSLIVLPALIFATLPLLQAPTPAAAAEPLPTRVVSYADLNLATEAGQRRLQRRIDHAARSVCAPLDGRSLKEAAAWRECVAQASTGARAVLPVPATIARSTTPR